MGIVVVSMRAARLASCKDNEADFRLKIYESIFQLKLLRFLLVKFIYSEKATQFCEIFNLLWSYVSVEISQNFVAFSEYMNFKPKSRPMQATKGTQKTCPFEIKVKPKNFLNFASIRH